MEIYNSKDLADSIRRIADEIEKSEQIESYDISFVPEEAEEPFGLGYRFPVRFKTGRVDVRFSATFYRRG